MSFLFDLKLSVRQLLECVRCEVAVPYSAVHISVLLSLFSGHDCFVFLLFYVLYSIFFYFLLLGGGDLTKLL